MHYVYLLRSKVKSNFYVGSTSDLRRRLQQHNDGLNRSTRFGVPWEVIYYEAFPTKALAMDREYKLKHYGRGLVELKKRLGFS